jgi:hypothetical protein
MSRTRGSLVALFALLGAGLALAQDSALYALPDATDSPVQSGILLELAGGDLLVAAGDALVRVDPADGTEIAMIALGAPLAGLASDGPAAVAAGLVSGRVVTVDLESATALDDRCLGSPLAALLGDSDGGLLVALRNPDRLVRLADKSGAPDWSIDLPYAALGLTRWGDFLYITHDGWLSLVFLPAERLIETIAVGAGTAGGSALVVDAVAGVGYVAHHIVNPTAVGDPLARDRVFVPVVDVIDLATMRWLPARRVAFALADRTVHLPGPAVLNRARTQLLIAHRGSDALTVLDLASGTAVDHVRVGVVPTGILLTRDGGRVVSANRGDGTISVVGTRWWNEDLRVAVGAGQPSIALRGEALYHAARDPRLTPLRSLSCAACHGQTRAGGLAPAIAGWQGAAAWVDGHITQMMGGEGLGDGVDMAALLALLADSGDGGQCRVPPAED